MKDKITPSELLDTLKRLEKSEETKIITTKNPPHRPKLIKLGDSAFMWVPA